jgi:hypothetical protein
MSDLASTFFGRPWRPKPPTPPTPAPSPLRAVAVWTVPNAVVKLDSIGSGITNEDGYWCWKEVPVALGATHLWVTAVGYEAYSQHLDLQTQQVNQDILVGFTREGGSLPTDINLPPLVSDHVDPSVFTLRELARIRGAMWTVRGPWAYGPRPGQPTNITALEYFYAYGSDPKNLTQTQKDMLATYKKDGYTHMCFGPINAQSYHGMYPDTLFTSPEMFEVWLDWLQVFWDNGLAPICFLHPDGASFDDTVAMYDHLIRHNPRAQKLMRIVVPAGWEPTRYDWSSYTWAKYFEWVRDLLPNALRLLHTVPDVDAPCGKDERGDDEADAAAGNPTKDVRVNAWRRVCPLIHGWLNQSARFEDPDVHNDPNNPQYTSFENWANMFSKTYSGSYYDRFHNGYAGWPTTSAWGNEPIYIYAGEYCSYWEYWYDRPYDEGVKWGNRAMSVGADGYLDSGTAAVPGRA